METRQEEFSGSGRKPDDFALVQVSSKGEGNTYPRFTKATFRRDFVRSMDEYKKSIEKRHQRNLKHLRKLYKDYPDKETLEILKFEETITFKWVRFTYKINKIK